MTGCDPFQSRILREQLFIEHNLLVLTPQFSESTFEPLPNRLERARNLANPINVAVFCYGAGIDACNRGCRREKILDHFWYQPPLTGLRRLANNRPEVQLPF